MNSLISEVHVSNYIIKKPVPSNIKDQYISEIWYKNNDILIKPIIQTPKLKIKYGARRFTDDGPYSYCVTMHNRDIDQYIGKFYDMIREFDQYVIKTYNANRKIWTLDASVLNKYCSALRRKTTNDEYYLKLKLLADVDGTILTLINNEYREQCMPENIKYGFYTDQYIEPAYIVYNKEGIHPIWHVHQLVISNIEKVFLRDCLLDQINPYTVSNESSKLQPAAEVKLSVKLPVKQVQRLPLCKINVCDIQEAMKKLKKSNISECNETDTEVLFSTKDLQEKKKTLKHVCQ